MWQSCGGEGRRDSPPLPPSRPHASPEGLQRPSWATKGIINNLIYKYCDKRAGPQELRRWGGVRITHDTGSHETEMKC
ncbi:hypothetical protein E2C01_021740 [Portunus trituberculatus]|uniref:Uncharacterized protein n=1 Tax=Portunus trituberculatus TaxID=210409 RepID=A0A5B7E3C9_PORTR|nr:hypothetical protein [Portunus trituberculatus]